MINHNHNWSGHAVLKKFACTISVDNRMFEIKRWEVIYFRINGRRNYWLLKVPTLHSYCRMSHKPLSMYGVKNELQPNQMFRLRAGYEWPW